MYILKENVWNIKNFGIIAGKKKNNNNYKKKIKEKVWHKCSDHLDPDECKYGIFIARACIEG